ncbi:hypothetical protein BGC07_10435 [Piscirickettsia litoralis]|uniref:Uncharacterized protein n=2 Tax=Piscirickettsia litoralis TaxID=1891921 RepID=A0ABX3A5D1_9GAMM|nr:hypothetical protein BGC07_10435 [Piscirickettsia litoralis]
MGISQWQARQPLAGARAAETITESKPEELVLLVPKRSWQKAAIRAFLDQLIANVPNLRYEIEETSLPQHGLYWGLGILQTDVEENLPEVERFIASGPLKKQLWQKLWQWKNAII